MNNMELDYILGMKKLPSCNGFGSYRNDSKFSCGAWIESQHSECIECKRITKEYPNMWKSFGKDRVFHIKRKLGEL